MTLFNNICRQHDDAIEKQLATRQLNVKTTESKSWFTILKKTLIKYDFSNINELLAKPPKKSIWKSLIMKAVERYWAKKITLSSFDVELTGRKLFFYCVIMLPTYVVKQSHIFDI
jgi:hypothetical protein